MECSVLLTLHLLIFYLKLAYSDVIHVAENQYEGSLCYLADKNRTRGQCRKSCPDLDISEYKNNICNPGSTPTLYCCYDKEIAELYPTLYDACLDRLLAENLFKKFDDGPIKSEIDQFLRETHGETNDEIRADCETSKLKVEIEERAAYYRMCMLRIREFPSSPVFESSNSTIELPDPSVAGLGFRSTNRGSIRIRWLCTGYFVHPVYVLTSASCLTRNGQTPNIVRHGRTNLNDDIYDTPDAGGLSTYRIIDVVIHEQYDERTSFADIALVEVFRDVAFESSIHLKPVPACLWTKKVKPRENFAIVGYDDVLHVGLPGFYDPRTCNYDQNVSQGTMECLSCGFPVQMKVVGILLHAEQLNQNVDYVYAVGSNAYPCRKPTDGALFTFIYPYLEWIENVISR